MASGEAPQFPSSLEQALSSFRADIEKLGGAVTRTAPDPSSPNDTIDIGRLGPEGARRVVLHIAGTHGIEGYLGAAIQDRILLRLIERGTDATATLPPETSVVMVRCLNPWGMRHLRRVNRNNVDLNRNFLADGRLYAGAPDAYAALNLFCNPIHPPSRFSPFLPAALLQIAKHGFSALKQALTGGQYEFPLGVYYGGNSLQGESQVMLDLLRNFSQAQCLDVIEVHSGLGPWGHDTIFFGGNDPSRAAELQQLSGRPLQSDDPSVGVGIRTEGDLMRAALRLRGSLSTSWMLQEFGTYGPITMFAALRAENSHHHFGEGQPPSHWSKQRLLECFCPSNQNWRRAVLSRGEVLFQSVLWAVR